LHQWRWGRGLHDLCPLSVRCPICFFNHEVPFSALFLPVRHQFGFRRWKAQNGPKQFQKGRYQRVTMKADKSQPPSSRSKQVDWSKFLGPVEDLESYVKADWWRQIFNANYLRTDGDVVEDPSITKREIDLFLSVLTPGKNNFILDLCC